jgi:hypothetical protein
MMDITEDCYGRQKTIDFVRRPARTASLISTAAPGPALVRQWLDVRAETCRAGGPQRVAAGACRPVSSPTQPGTLACSPK